MTAAASAARPLRVDDLLSQPADVKVTLHPPAIARDRVYGPLLRRATTLAAAYAGPRTLGTTALTALERTDEVDVATNDAGEAVIFLLGVPGDLDVTRVVDENGLPVWKLVVGDVRESYTEFEPAEGSSASLFVLPQRAWVVAAGPARSRTREALVRASGAVSFVAGNTALANLSIRGGALLRRDERLKSGALAPLGRSLLRASFELTPGAEGVILSRLEYSDATSAADAEQTAHDIVGAFRRKLEEIDQRGPGAPQRVRSPPLSWLAAAGIEREQATVRVRAPIPKAWLDAMAQADVSLDVSRETRAAPAEDVPWSLWRRSAPAPTLSLPP